MIQNQRKTKNSTHTKGMANREDIKYEINKN